MAGRGDTGIGSGREREQGVVGRGNRGTRQRNKPIMSKLIYFSP